MEYTVVLRSPTGTIVGTTVFQSRRLAAQSLQAYTKKVILRDKARSIYTVCVGASK